MAQHKMQFEVIEADTAADLKTALTPLGLEKWECVSVTEFGGKLVATLQKPTASPAPSIAP